MARFVILRHDSPQGEHFDFMLEAADLLKTWALPGPPELGMAMDCEALADHRLAYLDYEGPVSGQRGSVTQWDHGTYATERRTDTEWVVNLFGQTFIARATLLQLADKPNYWRVSFTERGSA